MKDIVNFQGAKSTVHKFNIKFFSIAFLAFSAVAFNACDRANTAVGTSASGADTAATVNGKAIKMEEVERELKQQERGQEAKLSPLVLAAKRLGVLQGLIGREVMYQKAEKEGTVPSDEDVNAEYNRAKTQSTLSAEAFDKQMKEIGQTDQSARESIKKDLAIQKLIDKVTGKIEPPKDSEIEAFFNSNKEAFIKKKGVKLAAIVIDPANNGEGDTTTNEQEAVTKGNEIIKQIQQGVDFAQIAREKSEDQSRVQGGDIGEFSVDDMKQIFPPQVVAALMDPKFNVGQILPTPIQGKFYILKLQERTDNDEERTLESPGVRQQAVKVLIDSRKKLLADSYQAIAMNEAKIENYLAKKVVENPNELSGARPASAETPAANTNTSTPANVNSAANTNANVAANAGVKPATNANKAK